MKCIETVIPAGANPFFPVSLYSVTGLDCAIFVSAFLTSKFSPGLTRLHTLSIFSSPNTVSITLPDLKLGLCQQAAGFLLFAATLAPELLGPSNRLQICSKEKKIHLNNVKKRLYFDKNVTGL